MVHCRRFFSQKNAPHIVGMKWRLREARPWTSSLYINGPPGWGHVGRSGPHRSLCLQQSTVCPCRSGPQQSVPSAVHSVPQQLSPVRLARFCPLGIEVEKQGFRTAWLITGQKFPWKNLESGSSLLTFRDLSSHICEIILWIAKSWILDPGSCSKFWIFSNTIFCGFLKK